MIKEYLSDKKDIIITTAFILIVFFTVAVLYQELKTVVIYAALIIIVLEILMFVFLYPRYRERMEYLKKMSLIEDPSSSADHLPMISSCEIALYQDLIRSLCDSYRYYVTEEDQKYQDRTDYFGMWAHQIKTPIAAMHLLIDDKDVPEVKDQLFRIEEYVSMVMHYLKTDDITKDFVLKKYDLDKIIEQAIHHYSGLFIRKKLKLNYEPTGMKTVTDEKWLLFTIEQILSNSLKYTREGSISIYTQNTELVIEDTGCGIAQEDLPRMFEKGYTGYNGRMDKRSSGLGLYLCKKVLVQLGHTIRIESNAGEGTRVIFGLNLTEK